MKHRNTYYWYCQFAGWGMFIFIYIFFYFTQRTSQEDYPYYFHVTFFEAGAGFFITHFFRIAIRKTKLLTLSVTGQTTSLFLLTLGFALLYNTLVVAVEQTQGWDPDYYSAAFFWQKWFRILLGSLLIFTVWCLLYFTYHYVTRAQEQRINQVRMESLVKELELKTIKAQINPHFIFNALNSIRALVDENPEKARTAITQLGQLLRSSMKDNNEELVPFFKELAVVKNYLALEKIRFENRLVVEFNITEETLQQKIPPMMLQTLVENAIKHGINNEIKGGKITIESSKRNNFHELLITNTGKIRKKAIYHEGFGLSSTRNRLELLFGNKASFEINEVSGNQVAARVSMPWETCSSSK